MLSAKLETGLPLGGVLKGVPGMAKALLVFAGLSRPETLAGLSRPETLAGLSRPETLAGLSRPETLAGLSRPGVWDPDARGPRTQKFFPLSRKWGQNCSLATHFLKTRQN
jgi:hypothetical protein